MSRKKTGEVYPDHNGEVWYVYGWPTGDRAFSTQLDAERAWEIAKEHARDEVEAIADKVRDALP